MNSLAVKCLIPALKSTLSPAWLAATMMLAAAGSQAQSLVYSGRLDDPGNAALVASDLGAASFADAPAIANNVALYTLNVVADGLVTIQSTGFLAGGADPYFTLFSGGGNTATWLASNYTQAFTTGGDFGYSGVLTAGLYRVALGAFANMSFAENLGSGTLADGFIALGQPDLLGSSGYRLVINVPVPEPAAWLLLVAGVPLLAVRKRLQTQH